MGNNNSPVEVQNYKTQQWQQILQQQLSKSSQLFNNPLIKILQHRKIRNLQVQVYLLHFTTVNEYRTYSQSYEWRKSIPSLVTPHYLDNSLKRDYCSTFYSSLAYIERIPYRISDLSLCSIPQGMYIIKNALEGFGQIYVKTGYFQIQQNLFCFNVQGRSKIWLNENISKNYPDLSKIDHNKHQKEFINQIIKKVQKFIQYGKLQKFSQYLYQSNLLDQDICFRDIFTLLKLYIRLNNIQSVNFIQRIVNKQHRKTPLTKVKSLTKIRLSKNKFQSLPTNQRNIITFRQMNKNNFQKDKKQSMKKLLNDTTNILSKGSQTSPSENIKSTHQSNFYSNSSKTQESYFQFYKPVMRKGIQTQYQISKQLELKKAPNNKTFGFQFMQSQYSKLQQQRTTKNSQGFKSLRYFIDKKQYKKRQDGICDLKSFFKTNC